MSKLRHGDPGTIGQHGTDEFAFSDQEDEMDEQEIDAWTQAHLELDAFLAAVEAGDPDALAELANL